MGAFDFPDLVPDEKNKELISRTTHIRYCYLKTQKLEKMPQRTCKCGNSSFYRFGTRTTHYRDLPNLQDRIVLVIKKQRFICRARGCGRTFVQEIPGLDSRRFMTSRCLEWIRDNCLRFTFQHIADHIGCDLRTVRDIAYERMDELDNAYQPYLPVWLGIDETYFKGNIHECCSVFVDLHRHRPVDLIHGHGKEEVSEWLLRFSDRSHVEGVAMDMAGHFRDVVREVLPYAQIVADRFHIEKRVNKALTTVRDRTERRLKKELGDQWDADEWKPYSRLLLKHMHQILEENDPAKEGEISHVKKRVKVRLQPTGSEFMKWLDWHSDLKIAYELKESLCNIYRCKRRFKADKALTRWEASIKALEAREPRIDDSTLGPFRDLLKTITKWKIEILAFFPEGKSNGYTEAFNSVLKRMDRSGNNYSFDVLRARVLFSRKPRHEIVKLIPPKLEEFLRNSQPPSEICLLCGQSFNSNEFSFDTNDKAGNTSVAKHDDGLEKSKCPLCRKRINFRVLEGYVRSKPVEKRFSEDYFKDLEVGDVKSAAQYSATICANCGRTSDAVRLFPWRLQFLGGKYLHICEACREETDVQAGDDQVRDQLTRQSGPIRELGCTSLIDKPMGPATSAPPPDASASFSPYPAGDTPEIDSIPSHDNEAFVPAAKNMRRRRTLAKELGRGARNRPQVRPKQLLLFPISSSDQ